MKKDKNKDNLPIERNNNFRTKIRKAMFIVLSSLGIATTVAPTVNVSAQTNIQKEIEGNDRQTRREKFIDDLSVRKNNEKIVDQLVENREQEYSIATGNGEKAKELLVRILDKIDQNFEMNVKKKGKMAAWTKEEFKNNYINLIKKLDDIIVVDEDTEENQYTEYFKSKFGVVGTYIRKEIKNEKGVIPKNAIIMNCKKEYNSIEYIMIHELTHSEQKGAKDNKLAVNYNNIISLLKEGNSNSKADYIRDYNKITEKYNSLNAYGCHTMLYNKLSFLVGENEMNEYMKSYLDEENLFVFLSNKLDSRYGEGTGASLYSYITNISVYVNALSTNLKTEKIEKLYKEIDTKNERIQNEIQEKGSDDTLKEILDVNNNLKQMLDKIYEKDNKGRKEELNKQLEGLEKLTLQCVNKDIEKIDNKKEAIDYVQIWDYYRNKCTINKGSFKGEEKTLFSENFKELKDVQKNLYNKCKKYKALNIKDEKIFNCLIESQLYNVKNATVSYNKNKTKLTISDEYVINEFKIKAKKDGSKKYENIDKHKNDKGIAKGTKVLAQREVDKERD